MGKQNEAIELLSPKQIEIPDRLKAEVEDYRAKLAKVSSKVEKLVITNDDDIAVLSDAMGSTKTIMDSAEALRTQLVAPVNGLVKLVNATFKTVSDPGAALINELKARIIDYRNKVRAEEEKQRRIAEEKARKEQEEYTRKVREAEEKARLAQKPVVLPPPPKPVEIPVAESKLTNTVTGNKSTVGIRRVKTYKIVNEDLIPRKYLVPSDAMIKAAIKEGKFNDDIPGILIYEEEEITSSRR
jgi:hypothetical protein